MRGLMLHAGAHAATREQVAAVVTPQSTDTWQPISHETIIATAQAALASRGLMVKEEGYGLWAGGQRFFGVLQVENGQRYTDHGMLVGLRNSHDKTFPAGLAIGSIVFVCDNQSFSGEVVMNRKHSTRIMVDLPGLVDRAIERLLGLGKYQEQRIAAYKEAPLLETPKVHDLVIRSLDAGVIGPTKVVKVLQEWRAPRHEEFADRTLWSLFNSFTEVLKGSGGLLPQKTMRLHKLFDAEIGLEAPERGTEVVGEDATITQTVGTN